MMDGKIWAEAKDIAKDQMRHGKIHYADFEKATKVIYDDLIRMENGPVIDVNLIGQQPLQAALPASDESVFKHELVAGKIRCAICGKLFKSLSSNHLNSHKMTRDEYMVKFGVDDKDMHGDIKRNVLMGDDNSLKILSYIMDAYGLTRNKVKPFVIENGFDGLKDLMKQAKDKNISALDMLKEKAPIPDRKGE